MLNKSNLQCFKSIAKRGLKLGSHPFYWNEHNNSAAPYLELTGSRLKLCHWRLCFLFKILFCSTHVVRCIQIMHSGSASTTQTIFIVSITVFYSIDLVYHFATASNLEGIPRSMRDFTGYFTLKIDCGMQEIAGGVWAPQEKIGPQMAQCARVVNAVQSLYWFYYMSLLVGATLRPSSPHVLLSLTWPVKNPTTAQILLSFLAWNYFYLCYVTVAGLYFCMLFTWFRVLILYLKNLRQVYRARTVSWTIFVIIVRSDFPGH